MANRSWDPFSPHGATKAKTASSRSNVPDSSWTKAQIEQYAEENGVEVSSSMTKDEMLEAVSQ